MDHRTYYTQLPSVENVLKEVLGSSVIFQHLIRCDYTVVCKLTGHVFESIISSYSTSLRVISIMCQLRVEREHK